MTAAVMNHNMNLRDADFHMARPVGISLAFHTLIIAIILIGFPYISPEIEDIVDPVPVEIINESDMPQTDQKPAASEHRRAPVDEKPQEEPPRPQAPTVTSATPPKPVAPQPPEPKESVPMPKDDVLDKVPAPEAKPAAPPKPLKRPMLTQKTADEQEQQEDFQSVLRNLMQPVPAPAAPSQAQETGEKPSPLAQYGQQMTSSELDMLRQQLSECWKLMAGARYAEDLIVDIKLYMNPDRTIRDAQILDQFRYFGDSYFRAAADSALRAVRNPSCSPLQLPPEKYEQWKVMTVTFDPREML